MSSRFVTSKDWAMSSYSAVLPPLASSAITARRTLWIGVMENFRQTYSISFDVLSRKSCEYPFTSNCFRIAFRQATVFTAPVLILYARLSSGAYGSFSDQSSSFYIILLLYIVSRIIAKEKVTERTVFLSAHHFRYGSKYFLNTI